MVRLQSIGSISNGASCSGGHRSITQCGLCKHFDINCQIQHDVMNHYVHSPHVHDCRIAARRPLILCACLHSMCCARSVAKHPPDNLLVAAAWLMSIRSFDFLPPLEL